MSRIQKKFQTKSNATEMKSYISTKLLPNPALSSLLDSANWIDNTLYIQSKLGKGTITLRDYLIEVDIELTLFGQIAQKTIETTIDNEFKLLN
jgi:hypothetical protein